MSNQNRNRPYPRVQEEKTVIDDAHAGGRRGSLIGALAGGGAGGALSKKKKLYGGTIGALAGAVAGHAAGRRIGAAAGARDVKDARRALRQSNQLAELRAEVNELMARAAAHDFESIDDATAKKPISGIPNRLPRRPSVRGMRSAPGNGASAEALFAEAREDIASRWGWGIASSLADDELDDEHAEALHDAIMAEIQRTDSPSAGVKRGEDFERQYFEAKLGPAAVARMGKAELHALFVAHQRNGTIELDDQDATTDLAILTRERTDTGQFAPEGQTDSLAVQRAYARSPRERRTGVSVATGAAGVAAGLAGAYAHLRGKKRRAPRLDAGSPPALPLARGADFAARAGDDERGHGARNAAITAGAVAGLTGAALLAARRLRRGRVPRLKSGTPALPPRTSPPTYDVDTQVMSRRLPLLTQLAMGKVGSYKIRRANLKGKRPPTGIHPRQLGKAKPKHFGFLIHDPDFEIDPVQTRPKNAGARKIPVTKNRAQLIKWLKGMTALSRRDFGLGSAVAEGAIDALGIGEATTPKKKKVMVDSRGNVLAPPQQLTDPGTTSTASFDSAIARLIELGYGEAIGRGAARFAPEVAAIGIGDVLGETAHDRLKAAQDKKRRRLMRQRGGVESLPGMGTAPGVQTTMSSVHDTLVEFDSDASRDRARKRAGELGAGGVGGVAGALGGAYHDQGKPVRVRDLRPGDQVYRRQGPGGIYQHTGVVGEDGNIVHRSRGSSVSRSVKPESFVKGGRGPLRRESHPDDLPRARAARNASAAAGTRQGKYSLAGENCQHASSRIASKGAPVSRQLRKVVGGAAIGALGGATVASVLNRKNRKDK